MDALPNFKDSKNNNLDIYIGGAVITGFLAFVALWIYAITQWGLLIGLLIGWLPALIGAFIAGLLWPLVLLILGVFAYMIFKGN